ncbi:GLEYA domain-domain-containing protein, partial [Coniella lustricola]
SVLSSSVAPGTSIQSTASLPGPASRPSSVGPSLTSSLVPNNPSSTVAQPLQSASSSPSTRLPTTTNQPAGPVPSTCGNSLLQWAYYSSPWLDDALGIFQPDSFATVTPSLSGVTDQQAAITGSCSTTSEGEIYGNVVPCTNFALNYRGYVYVNSTGEYTVTTPQNSAMPDDRLYIWVGPSAYSGWNGDNYDILASATTESSTAQSITFYATAGEYVPFRFFYYQVLGKFGFEVTITGPDGMVLMGPGRMNSDLIVEYSCDGRAGPRFPAYGQE